MLKILIFVTDAQLFLMLRFLLNRAGFEALLVTTPADVSVLAGSRQIVAMLVDKGAGDAGLNAGFRHARTLFPSASFIHLLRKTPFGEISSDACDLLLESPLDPALLVSFLQRLRNRSIEEERADTGAILRFADLSMDLAAVKVHRAGRDIHLTALEFRLLRRLLQTPLAVCDRDVLIEACWPQTAEVEPRTVDIHIGHIRRALMGTGPDLIRTIRGRGYALEVPS